jgi:hypothetical protein
MLDVTVLSADGRIKKFGMDLEPTPDALMLVQAKIRIKGLFPPGTKLVTLYVERPPLNYDSDNDDDDDPSKSFVVVRGIGKGGRHQTFQSQTSTIDSDIQAALVFHKGNIQKAADWVSKKI